MNDLGCSILSLLESVRFVVSLLVIRTHATEEFADATQLNPEFPLAFSSILFGHLSIETHREKKFFLSSTDTTAMKSSRAYPIDSQALFRKNVFACRIHHGSVHFSNPSFFPSNGLRAI